jgi:hypothetical protein
MDFDKLIITNYSPISARGGRKRTRKFSRKLKTRKYKRTNTYSKNGRTRRRHR